MGMGEATPAQSTTGTFVPMLGLGAMPTGVTNGPVVAPSRGPVGPPPLHNAIVERLRARIELCRRHHSNCENRYQRGQAESSDREHESTLHLLNIVHQGPGTRKTKGSRASNQQPPEYSRAIGDQKSAEGEQRISTRIAVSWMFENRIQGRLFEGGGMKPLPYKYHPRNKTTNLSKATTVQREMMTDLGSYHLKKYCIQNKLIFGQ